MIKVKIQIQKYYGYNDMNIYNGEKFMTITIQKKISLHYELTQHVFLYYSYLQTIKEYNFMYYIVSEVGTSAFNELKFFMNQHLMTRKCKNKKVCDLQKIL